jgi:hypothetical protein
MTIGFNNQNESKDHWNRLVQYIKRYVLHRLLHLIVICSLFNDAFSVSQTIYRRFLLNPDSSAI